MAGRNIVEGVTNREVIYAAFRLGANIGRQSVVAGLLKQYGIDLTPEMADRLSGFQAGIELSGYEPFELITTLDVPPEVHAKFLSGNPRVLIIAQLVELSEEELLEHYKLTPEEVEAVKRKFEFANWRLRPNLSTSS